MMNLPLVWPESEKTTRGSSNADWFVAHVLTQDLTDPGGPVGCESG